MATVMHWLAKILADLPTDTPLDFAWYIFANGGWVIFVVVVLFGLQPIWLARVRSKYFAKWDWVTLAIDVPKLNEQSPKAVEGVFSTLAGTQSSPDFIEKYLDGKVQESFSFEIISIEGGIQFLVHVPVHFRDLIEAAIFAQYPEAEITEVADYTQSYDLSFPDRSKGYDLWGTELTLANKDCYPINTYTHFEHELSQEFKDPMAALLEVLAKLGKGEQLWIQLIVSPSNQDWKDAGAKEVKKIIGEKVESKKNIIDHFSDLPLKAIEFAGETILPTLSEAPAKKEEKKEKNLIQSMTGREKGVVDAIQMKMAKIGFKCRLRVVYLAKKENFSKARGAAPVIGALQQFTSQDINGLKPVKKTKTAEPHLFKISRVSKLKNKILRGYRLRDATNGVEYATGFILNTEELATLWHFPNITVKAPMVKKVDAKKSEQPFSLPIEMDDVETRAVMEDEDDFLAGPGTQAATASLETDDEVPAVNRADEPPTNLPFG